MTSEKKKKKLKELRAQVMEAARQMYFLLVDDEEVADVLRSCAHEVTEVQTVERWQGA